MDWCSGESIHLPPGLPGFNFTSSVNAVYGLKYIIIQISYTVRILIF